MREEAIAIVRELVGQVNVITIPRAFAEFMGSLEGGAFLNQLLYWATRGALEDGWFWKSYPEWQAEISISPYIAAKLINECKARGFLETQVLYRAGARTQHYRVLWPEFVDAFTKHLSERKGAETVRENFDEQNFVDQKLDDGSSKTSRTPPVVREVFAEHTEITSAESTQKSTGARETPPPVAVDAEVAKIFAVTDGVADDDYVPPDPQAKPRAKVKTKAQGAPRDPTLQQLMVRAVADVCAMDLKLPTHAKRCGKTATELVAAAYTAAQVRAFSKWWLSDKWRAQNTPVPTPAQLIDKIAQSLQPRNGRAAAAEAVPERPDPPAQVKLRELRKQRPGGVREA